MSWAGLREASWSCGFRRRMRWAMRRKPTGIWKGARQRANCCWFPRMANISIHQARRANALQALVEPGLGAFLVTNRHNVRYLTGFTGSNGMVLLSANSEAILYTDPRYTVQSKQQADCKIRIAKGPL